MMSQEAAQKEVANSQLRRLLAYNKSCNCADAQAGDSSLFYKASSRKCAQRWRGPAKISDIDDSGATAKFRSQTFKVARYRVR